MADRNDAPMPSDSDKALLLAADLLERLISASTKWHGDERKKMLEAVDHIREYARTPRS